MPPRRVSRHDYTQFMSRIVVLAAIALFAAGNFYVWALKQAPIVLFWESMAAAAIVFPAFFWFVMRTGR
jgi:hypothetical protein